jgi:hypothetical protein
VNAYNNLFTEKSRDIRNQLNRLTEDLRRIQETQFRGSSDNTDVIIDNRMQSDYNDYSTGIMDTELAIFNAYIV